MTLGFRVYGDEGSKLKVQLPGGVDVYVRAPYFTLK